ncbi:MAG: restriction endonuclease subunit S [Campylobacter sp.]|uniref:restriction endonuclease subunit S n=1 Tax=Campylobacter sp. TaxID=205 RepID=UPI002A900972|nr:restriction endonuclease subunit S [Campylobacter sp.]MCI6695056.1 restriction endonuclease subunit S [Campylobacter sp.]MDY4860065.1 restriction endonuclease subunit S [Campylobacter sp.]
MKSRILEFKDSGIAWIGQIPKHWEAIRNKYVFTHKKEIVGSKFKNFDILSLTKNGIKIIVESDQKGKVPDSFETYQIVKKDDIVMCLFDLDVSAVFSGISKYSGIISPAYKIFNPKENLNFKFAGYFFDFVFVNRKFKQYSKNIRFTLGTDEFMNLKIPLPPLDEQKKIAEFLDKKCEIIDKRVENLERKINTLKEYKKSLISECVTKGLNSRILEFKDSKIPWIGQIPKHWEISKIKYYFNFSSGLNITKENLIESGIPVISYGQIHSKENTGTFIKDSFFRFISQDYLKNKKSLVNKGNFIFADTSEDLDGAGNSVFVDLDLTMFAGYHTIILKNKCNFEFSKFLSYLFQTDLWRSQIRLAVSGVKVFSITKKILANCEILVPPLNEQKEIAEFLDKKCEKIDRLNENYTKQITTLKEYKKSLIYECVTGKKEI